MAGDDLVGGPPEREQRVRRRWRAIALVLAAVAAAAIGLPRLSLHADSPAPADRDAARRLPDPPVEADFRWPLRGDLADDNAFVSAALQRLPVRASHWRPLFAGRLPDGSRLVLAGSRLDPAVTGTSVAAVRLAPGATPEWTVSQVAALTDPAQLLGWAAATAGSDGSVFAVALGPPRPLRLQVSGHLDFARDGSPGRTWQTLSSPDGTVVADLGRRTDPSIAVRSLGPSSSPSPVLVPVAGDPPATAEQIVVDGIGAAGYAGPRPDRLRRGLLAETENLIDLGATTQRVIWSGVPWARRHFALVLITRPDGRRFQALVGEQADGWFPAGVRALGDDDPDELPWLLEPFSVSDPTLLLCPTGPGSLDYRHHGARTQLRIRPDGVVGLVEPGPSPPRVGGARVTVRAPDGTRLLTTVLPRTGFEDPLALADR